MKWNNMKYAASLIISFICLSLFSQKQEVDYVNPFIGTSNYGATHPGAIAPRGMASVSPFNVSGDLSFNPLEKDSQWLSNPYVHENSFLTGFSHVNLSGVGCPDLGVIISMPTTGALEVDHLKYGSTYTNERAEAGYYGVKLEKYNVQVEATASERVGVTSYKFPSGRANILLNLGLGLTNEQGGTLKIVANNEVEGMRTVGSFCYNNSEGAYPVYFVARLSQPSDNFGIWKDYREYEGHEAQWMGYNGKVRLKEGFRQEVIGDSIGAYFSFDLEKETNIEMKIGISYVSMENARENLEKETGDQDFSRIYRQTREKWQDKLSRIEVKGGTEEDKSVFYTALYHTQIHPNILNDINGEYPKLNGRETGKTDETRYSAFSLWDTYRNYHQLMSLIYPDEQIAMVNSILEMYKENNWLPKWELNSTETFTMVGDPASVVLADTYLRGLTGFDIELAYEGMIKGATNLGENPLRPGLEEYIEYGFLSVESGVPGMVSTTLEYNIADYAISQLADNLGKMKDARLFKNRSLSYRNLFDESTGLLRPKRKNNEWFAPFDPEAGANFTENVGFIEGNAYQYVFMVPHDIPNMIELQGGNDNFVEKLDYIFDYQHYDMANEPDFGYPFLYNFVKGSEWKTQERVNGLLNKYYKNSPDGLPGNDDTGTMSAWAVFSMMGIYPVIPAEPVYTFVTPQFDEITIHLDEDYYDSKQLIIQASNAGQKQLIDSILVNDHVWDGFFINHSELIDANKVIFHLKN